MSELVGEGSELSETAVIAGQTTNVIGLTPNRGALLAGTEVEGRVTQLWLHVDDFDASGAEHGDSVTFRSLSYTIAMIEHHDPGLVRLELQR